MINMKRLFLALLLAIFANASIAQDTFLKYFDSIQLNKSDFAVRVDEKIEYLVKVEKYAENQSEPLSHYIVLGGKEGFLFYNPKTPGSLTYLKPPFYSLNISDNPRSAVINSADFNNVFDFGPYNIARLAIEPKETLKALAEAADLQKGNIGFNDGILELSYGEYAYLAKIESGKVVEFECYTLNPSQPISVKAQFHYESQIIPSSIVVMYCYKGKAAIRKVYSYKLLAEKDPGSLTNFNVEKLGIFHFTDNRTPQPLTYYYEGGVPSVEEAAGLAELMEIKDIKTDLHREWVDIDKQNPSAFSQEVFNCLKNYNLIE